MTNENHNFSHKFLPIIAIFIFILFILCSTSFGSFSLSDSEDNIYMLPNIPTKEQVGIDYQGYSIFISPSGNYAYACFAENTSIDTKIFSNPYVNSDANIIAFADAYIYKCDINSFNSTSEWYFDRHLVKSGDNYKGLSYSKFLYTNYNLTDINGSVVFQPAPTPSYQIPAITETEELTEIIQGVLKVILPIGLTIFGIGLVIFLMRLVILRVK